MVYKIHVKIAALPVFLSLLVVVFLSGSVASGGVFPPRYSLDVSEVTAHPVQDEPLLADSGVCSATTQQQNFKINFL